MEKVERAVRGFDARARQMERVRVNLDSVLGCAPECALNEAVNNLFEGYLNALESAYGIRGWLEWWWLECRLGGRPMKSGFEGEELRVIASVDDLVRLVLDDLARGVTSEIS